MNSVIHNLEPIYDANSKVLILGSFPSVISRKKGFYYANPNNRFWKVMKSIYEEKIEDYTTFCKKHHLALWDVIQSCTIEGSSDNTIKNIIPNDIESLLSQTKISMIFTTGKKADELFQEYIHVECPHIALPSTSGANARYSLEKLIESYRVIREYAEAN